VLNLPQHLSSFLSYPDLRLPTHCSCGWLLEQLTTQSSTHTLGRTPLCEGSARRRDLYLTAHNTHIHALSGIRTRNPNKRASADPLRSAFLSFVSCDGRTGPFMQEILVLTAAQRGMEQPTAVVLVKVITL